MYIHNKVNTTNYMHKIKKIQKRDNQGKFTTGSGGFRLNKKLDWRRAAPVIMVIAIVGGIFVYQGFAAINRPAYKYSARVCDSQRAKQAENCRSLSAEAFTFRLHRSITGQSPSSNSYIQSVRNLVVDNLNPGQLTEEALVAHDTNHMTHQSFVANLYQRLFGKTYEQEKTAIDQWVAQLAHGNQTRAQVTYYLVRQSAAREHLASDFKNYYNSQPLVDISPNEPIQPEVPEEPDPEDPEQPDPEEPDPEIPVEAVLDIAVVGINFTGTNGDANFNTTADNLLAALQDHEPFNEPSMKDKVAYHRLNIQDHSYGCRGGWAPGGDEDDRFVTCDQKHQLRDRIETESVPFDKVAVVINNPLYGGSGEIGGTFAYTNAVANTTTTMVFTFVHELGHTFGLRDEYLYGGGMQDKYDQDDAGTPNRLEGQCVKATPSTWRNDWRDTEGVWSVWKDVPDVSWHFGCTADHWFRPAQVSIMGGSSEDENARFNTVSIEVIRAHWLDIINQKMENITN